MAMKDLFRQILDNVRRGRPYPNTRQATMFDNEIGLYLDPRRIFSLRMFFYGAGDFSPVHDHSAWGLITSVWGQLAVDKYRRLDDGRHEGYAHLVTREERCCGPGEIDVTLPLAEGIHRTGNRGPAPIVMVSLYGAPLRRLYVNCYDVTARKVYRMYEPRHRLRRLAEQVLASHPEKPTV
jgi:predicted metal-dependent enzyme (double-stranded beta helix superfamily)